MSRSEQVASRILAGSPPAVIADELGISPSSVMSYIDRAVGERLLRRSDVYLTVPEAEREEPSEEQQMVIERYGASLRGDMFQDVWDIESTLHARVFRRVDEKFGGEETGGWRQVPRNIREDCQTRRERDPSPVEVRRYTTLLQLSDIIRANWETLSSEVGLLASNKQKFAADMESLNGIRNTLMHPCRGEFPREQDFRFVGDLKRALRLSENRPA